VMRVVMWGERSDPMLCEICNKREATVHLTESGLGPETRHRDFCGVCFPCEGLSESELKKKAIGFLQDEPPDEPQKPK
jgi:protein-arginine kinase activator protein McsA